MLSFALVDGVRFVVRDGVLVSAEAAGIKPKHCCEGCCRPLFEDSEVAEWISQCNGGGGPYCFDCAARWRRIRADEYRAWRGMR